MDSFSVTIITD